MLVLGRVFDRFEWVNALTESHYDVVLVDVNTVGLVVATEHIRELEQSPHEMVSGVHTPTVGLCFAHYGAQVAEPAVVAQDGIDDCIAPLTEGAVLAKVREWTVRARNGPLRLVNLDRVYQYAGDVATMWAMVNEFVYDGASRIYALSPHSAHGRECASACRNHGGQIAARGPGKRISSPRCAYRVRTHPLWSAQLWVCVDCASRLAPPEATFRAAWE